MNKFCPKCKIEKDFSEFYKSNFFKDTDGFCRICKKCKFEQDKKYREKHKKERKKYLEKNKQILEKKHKEYRQKNRDKRRKDDRKRRIKELNSEGSHTELEWLNKKKEYNYRCVYCGRHEEVLCKKYKDKRWWKLTEDHVIPISKEGSDFISNIVPACISCNTSKKAKLINN